MDLQSFFSNLPPDFWLKTAIFVIVIAVIVVAVRIYQQSNKLLLTMVIMAVCAVIFFNWVYNRTEPKWLTPAVDKLAHFFPTKDFDRKEAGGK